MNYTIIWSKKAEEDFLSIIEYLHTSFGNNSAIKFKEKILSHIQLTSSFPKMFSLTSFKTELRRCVVVKQISLYYLELEDKKELKIIRILDNRIDDKIIEEQLNIETI